MAYDLFESYVTLRHKNPLHDVKTKMQTKLRAYVEERPELDSMPGTELAEDFDDDDDEVDLLDTISKHQ